MQNGSANNMYRIGLVGTGYIADIHMEILKHLGNVQVIACCDTNHLKASDFQTRWNINTTYDNLDKMLSKEEVDVIHVLVPPDYHHMIAREALGAGKSIFIEKPMAVNRSQCHELLQLAKKNEVVIGVNHNAIFHPLFLRLKGDLRKGRIGKVDNVIYYQAGSLGQLEKGIFSHWMFREPKNVVLEQAPHPLSQIRDILGEIVEVNSIASGLRTLGKGQFFYDRWQTVARCEKGYATLYISFGKGPFPQSWLYVSGQDGAIRADLIKNLYLVQEKSLFPDYADPLANAMKYSFAMIDGVKNFFNYSFSKFKLIDRTDSFYVGMKNSLGNFYAALSQNREVPVTGNDGARVVEICEMWAESAKLRENTKPKQATSVIRGLDPHIMVTGATGFIGKHLVRRLVDQGLSVRILVRSAQGLVEELQNPLIEVFQGDITNPDQVNESVKGIQYIFHLAHGGGQTWKAFERTNFEATGCLAEAALREGIKYFIYTSTIAVYCYSDVPKGEKVNETMPIDSHPEKRNFYARSKILTENLLTQMVKKEHLPLVMFRPALVVGVGGRLYHDGVGLWTRDNVCAYWGMGNNELPFVLVDDVVDAMLKVLHTNSLEGEVFNLVGDERVSAREYLAVLKSESGRNIRHFPYPITLMFISEVFKYLIKMATNEHKNALLSYRDLSNRAILTDFDCSKAKRILGWQPCRDRKTFIKKAVSWAFEKERLYSGENE